MVSLIVMVVAVDMIRGDVPMVSPIAMVLALDGVMDRMGMGSVLPTSSTTAVLMSNRTLRHSIPMIKVVVVAMINEVLYR